MKKIFKYIIVVVLTLGIVVGTLYNDYKESQAAVLPVAIWGMTESVLSLFGAFGLGVGVSHAYKDSSIVDKDALTLLQDFRGFLAKGSNLSLPYTVIENQLNALEKTLADAQLKGYLTLIRGGVTCQESPTPDGPKRNKFEKGLIDSIKQYVVARHIIEKNQSNIDFQTDEKPVSGLEYNSTFYINKMNTFISLNGPCFYYSSSNKPNFYLNEIVSSPYYIWGTSNYILNGNKYISIFLPTSSLNDTHTFDSFIFSEYRFKVRNDVYKIEFVNRTNSTLSLNSLVAYSSGESKPLKDCIISTNFPLMLQYQKSLSHDLGTDGKISVNDKVGTIIDRDGNLDNYDIITHGTKVNPDGSVEGDINIPVPKRLPQNEPLPAGQTQPALEYGKQIDYGVGTDINGNTAINNIPSPDAAAQGDWTADEQSGIEKSKNLSMLFPFCIPFDLIAAFKLLSAKPQVPRWEFDWKIPTIDFSHHFVIDLSSFNILFMVLNKMILLSFIVGLILVTRNIIRG